MIFRDDPTAAFWDSMDDVIKEAITAGITYHKEKKNGVMKNSDNTIPYPIDNPMREYAIPANIGMRVADNTALYHLRLIIPVIKDDVMMIVYNHASSAAGNSLCDSNPSNCLTHSNDAAPDAISTKK